MADTLKDFERPDQSANPNNTGFPPPKPDATPPPSKREERFLRFFHAILTHRRWVIGAFILAALICALCIPQVSINYNLASYLPEEANSSQALDLMDEHYGTEIPNARLYAQGLSLSQASNLALSLSDIEGVNDVLWLGDEVDIKQPLEIANTNTLASWKTEEGYLYQLTVDADIAKDALDQVRTAASEAGATEVSLSGDIVTTVDAQESTAVEVAYIMLMAVFIIIVIISLTSVSWFEPVIFLLVLAIAIVLNMGTNIFKGEISFITQICAAVLQLAVSMDYAIVMLHTFRRYQKEYPDNAVLAMTHAMYKGFTVVLSSAAVTFFGFLSLSVMSFLIGVDMGIVLAKGIFFSFLSVMFLMPCTILAMLKPLEALQHKPLLPSFDRFGKWCTRLMIPISVVIVLLAVPSYLGQSKTDFTYGNAGFTEEGSALALNEAAINEAFGTDETWVMLVPEGNWAAEKSLTNDLKALPKVDGVISYTATVGEQIPVEMVPDEQRSQLISGGYSRIIIQTSLDSSAATDYDMVETVRDLGKEHYGDTAFLAGAQVSEYDLKDFTSSDSTKVKLFSMGAIALVLMLMFRSLSIPLIVLLPIEISIWLNLAIPYFTGQSLNYIGYLVIDAVQLGAAVDYAIIYTREYMEQRGKYTPLKAARVAISNSAITIMTSALILTIAGLSIFFVASNGLISEIGMLVGRGAFLAMIMMFTLLPLLFVAADWLIRHTTIGLKFYSEGKSKGQKHTADAELAGQHFGALRHTGYTKESVPASTTDVKGTNMNTSRKRNTSGQSVHKGITRIHSMGKGIACITSLVLALSLLPAPALAYAEEQATGNSTGNASTQPSETESTLSASASDQNTDDLSAAKPRIVKQELVYGKLTGAGSVDGIYVVNTFTGNEKATIKDPGNYSKVTNLTTEDELSVTNGTTELHLEEGDFSYQGELTQGTNLPWTIEIAYTLDGKTVDYTELAGATGELAIAMHIEASGSDTSFSENYLLQGSGSFSHDTTSNLRCAEGSLASAGSNEQLTLFVIPGTEADYLIEADIKDFSFDGFTFVGIPLSFALDLDEADTSDVEGSFSELQDAIAQLSVGASEISAHSGSVVNGLSSLAMQNEKLISGSSQINSGMQSMYEVSFALAQGSSLYRDSLYVQYTQSAAAAERYQDLAQQKQEDYGTALTGAKEGLGKAGIALGQAYYALSLDDPIAQQALLQEALATLADELSATGDAVSGINSAVGTAENPGLVSYQAGASAYEASAATLAGALDGYGELDAGIQGINSVMPEFTNLYSEFDAGLNLYTSGVATLNENYPALDRGMGDLASGAETLRLETMNLDQDIIDSLKTELELLLNPEFELHSFADESNTNVNKVQFIIRTDAVEVPAEAPVEDEPAEEQTIWTRFIALFE